VRITTPFQRSDPINRYARRRLWSTLGRYARHIEEVNLTISLVQSDRFHAAPKDTATRLRLTLKLSGRVIARGTAGDIRLSVSRAAVRARQIVARRISLQTRVVPRRRHVEARLGD
jgi:hypothetical protein